MAREIAGQSWEYFWTPWNEAVANSNHSTTVALPEYNVSQPWPGTPIDGWTITNTAIDLSRYNAVIEEGVVLTGFIGTDIKITAPKSLYVPSTNESDHGLLNVNAYPDWAFCMWAWSQSMKDNGTLAESSSSQDQPADGSCEQLASKECIAALEKAASTAYTMNYELRESTNGMRHHCDGITVPQECYGSRFDTKDRFWEDLNTPLQVLNGSTTFYYRWFNMEYDTAQDIRDKWKVVTQDHVSILTVFGRMNDDYWATSHVEPGLAKMTCLKTSFSEPGSRNKGNGSSESSGGDETSGGDEKNGAAIVRRGLVADLIVLAAVVYCLM
nr:uncharacterized protein CTRU02_03634 [Colletotrichum truncatum]KAF6796656.1 hypothetical protein CTRU02_03634 [Colletotrichum truncatum]